MASTAIKLAAALLLTAASVCSGQQNWTVRVCVNLETATLGGQITNSQRANVTFLHIQTDALSSHKPDKARHLVLEGMAVPQLGEPPSGIPGRSPYEKYGNSLSDADLKIARDNSCDYVLFSLVSNTAAQFGAVPHTAFPTPTQSIGAPYGGADTQAAEVAISVTYRLHRITPRAPVVEGTVSAHDTAPAYGLTSRALNMVANQVFTKIAKSSPQPAHTP
jgi:hypothetical protein